MRRIITCLVLTIAACPSARAFEADYALSLMGVGLGTATLKADVTPRRYSTRLDARLTGFAGVGTGSGWAKAEGAFANGSVVPSTFEAEVDHKGAKQVRRISMRGGDVRDVTVIPDVPPHPDRVVMAPEHAKDVLDPLSALLGGFVASKAGEDPCRRTIRVHDGTSRFDVVLTSAPGGGAPPTVTPSAQRCRASYVPVAGHRPRRWAVKYMRDNRDIYVWMAPAEGVYLPARISVATYLGTAVAEARRWDTPSR